MNPTNDDVHKSYIIIVDKHSEWKLSYPELKAVTPEEYLSNSECVKVKNAKVINLCKSYKYQSKGYYCSLLADARSHKIMPSTRTLQDLSSKVIYKLEVDDFDDEILDSLKDIQEPIDEFECYIIFGICNKPELQDIADEIFSTFKCPILKVEFKKFSGLWDVDTIKPITLNNLPVELEFLFVDAIEKYISKKWINIKKKHGLKYDLAILFNPEEKLSPSNIGALKNFIKYGKELNIDVDLIQKKDYNKLLEYDALFIRETTNIRNHTYKFIAKAESEGMPVIDDSLSLLKCTNKVYLSDLLDSNKVKIPDYFIMIKGKPIKQVENYIDYPIILKVPDGSFSLGVFKANDRNELRDITKKMFEETDVILAQQYLYTEFDWRVGVLNGKPLFASQYFMSKSHWQIYNHKKGENGLTKSIPIEHVPYEVIEIALKATKLIGNGLYGVDLKETRHDCFVIEVNDNPNIDKGEEDGVLKGELYRIILREFIDRIEKS